MSTILADREKLLIWGLSFFIFLFAVIQLHVNVFELTININLADFFVVLLFSSALVQFFTSRHIVHWQIPHFDLYMLATVLAIGLGWLHAIFSDYPSTWATSKLIGWFVILGYLYCPALLINRLGFMTFFRFFNLLLLFFVLSLLLSLGELFLKINTAVFSGSVNVSYLEGFSGNRNALAFQILAVISVLFAFEKLYQRRGNKYRSFFLVAVAVLIGTMLSTSSRSGIATLAIVCAAAFVLGVLNRYKLLVAVVAGLMIYLFVFYSGAFLISVSHGFLNSSAFNNVVPAISSDYSDFVRFELLKNSFVMWIDNFVFGAGLGAFFNSSESVYGFQLVQHNSVLWVLSEMGLFGLMLFVAPFASMFWYALRFCRSKIRRNAIVLLLLSLGAMAMFHEMLYQRLFWLFIGAMLAVGATVRNPPRLKGAQP